MNYDANTYQWQIGDLCLHDADAKTQKMLMVVEGYRKDGRCITRYLDPDIAGEKQWDNAIAVLHAPERFGVALPFHYAPNSNTVAQEPARPALVPVAVRWSEKESDDAA